MLTLDEIAHRALIERGFIPDFPKAVLNEAALLEETASPRPPFRDMRHLLWCSIDNDDSLDLDQLTFAEKEKIYVAIADVDSLVKQGSAIDRNGAHNTTSIYTPTKVFPMLPPKLSTNLTSLNEGVDRCAIVVEVNIGEDGLSYLADVYPAWVRNQAKLAYNGVTAWLERDEPLAAVDRVAGLGEQLKLQDQIGQRLKQYRRQQGALFFASTELQPVVSGGIVVELREKVESRAHELIEYFMIAANTAATRFLREKHLPTLRRVVRVPKRWDRIVTLANSVGGRLPSHPEAKALQEFLFEQQHANPEYFPDLCLAIIKLIGRGEYTLDPKQGHFDLALRDYAHTTAPNRRFPDLITQRLLKASLYGEKTPYRHQELSCLAKHCTEKENDASKVERRMIKSSAAFLLQHEIGQKFKAMVIGAKGKKTWVRLKIPPLEGKLVQGYEGLDVGDSIEVQLIRVDILNGHIDFKKI